MTASLWLLWGPAPKLCETLQLERSLSDAERRQASSFGSAERRAQYTVGRAVLRQLLSQALHLPANEIELHVEASGRPRLHPKHGSRVSFSISHSKDVVCWALHPSNSVGVDVEHQRRSGDISALAARFFHPRERDYVASAPDAFEAKCRFLLCWTLKEAWFKAFADSQSLVFADLGFELDVDVGRVSPLQTAPTPELRLWSTVFIEHLVSVAWQGPPSEDLVGWRLDSSTLEAIPLDVKPVVQFPTR